MKNCCGVDTNCFLNCFTCNNANNNTLIDTNLAVTAFRNARENTRYM